MLIPIRHIQYNHELLSEESIELPLAYKYIKDFYKEEQYFSFTRESMANRSVEHVHTHFLPWKLKRCGCKNDAWSVIWCVWIKNLSSLSEVKCMNYSIIHLLKHFQKSSFIPRIAYIFKISNKTRKHLKFIWSLKEKSISLKLHWIKFNKTMRGCWNRDNGNNSIL